MIELKAANEPEALLWVNKPAVGSLLRGCWPAQYGFMVRSMLLLLWQYKPMAGRA